MTQLVVLKPGYRIRDLVAGLVVVQIAAAFVYALYTDHSSAALKVPAVMFGIGIVLVGIAFSGGAIVDRVTRRYPSLIRPRRCPRLVLLALLAGAIAVALQQPHIMAWLMGAWESVDVGRWLAWVFE